VSDPWQLNNTVAALSADAKAGYVRQLHQLMACAGSSNCSNLPATMGVRGR
jgi:hypothetical protein